MAAALIPQVFEGEALLKDLSVTGCRIEVTTALDAAPGLRCTMRVEPEPAAKIRGFELQVELRWIKLGDYTCEAGFSIVESPQKSHFQRYVDYLDYRSA